MDELGPLQLFYCWQSVLLAVLITTCTHSVKAGIDVYVGGTDIRKQKRWMRKLVLPSIPLAIGTLFGLVIPLKPDVLLTYVATHNVSPHLLGASYGLFVGQFADYLYTRFMNKAQVPVPAAVNSIPPPPDSLAPPPDEKTEEGAR